MDWTGLSGPRLNYGSNSRELYHEKIRCRHYLLRAVPLEERTFEAPEEMIW